MWLQKISIPTPRRVIGIPMGWGSPTPKVLKETMKLNWNFQWGEGGGGGGEREYDIFWNSAL